MTIEDIIMLNPPFLIGNLIYLSIILNHHDVIHNYFKKLAMLHKHFDYDYNVSEGRRNCRHQMEYNFGERGKTARDGKSYILLYYVQLGSL